jgi:hypothetical protein
MSGQLVLYVGKTQNITKRERSHRSIYEGSGSKNIPKDMPWVLKEIERCHYTREKERERYWYDTLNPLYNLNRP